MTRADIRGGATPPHEEPATADPAGGSLESFVAQLHSEGVEAGRKEAEALVRRAEEEAAELVRRARGEAESLLARARTQAQDEQARGRAELELAIRDAVLGLQAALSEVLRAVMSRAAESHLSDPDTLGSLLREVVGAYARADAVGRPVQVRVPRRLGEALEAWWLRELADVLGGHGDAPELVAVLEEAGFEYRLEDGTVEVSVEAAVETLMALVRPGLRELVAEAARRAESGAAEGWPVAAAAGGSARRL